MRQNVLPFGHLLGEIELAVCLVLQLFDLTHANRFLDGINARRLVVFLYKRKWLKTNIIAVKNILKKHEQRDKEPKEEEE